jgi:CubicO group peptidase (beta-lactamase class C family)
VFAGGSAAQPRLEAPKRPITIRDLLTHTSGLTYGMFGRTPVDTIYLGAGLMNPSWTIAAFADSIAKLPLVFQPGTRWNYGMGIDVLGRVVEVVSGKSFDRYLDEDIFRPLKMTETTFHLRPEQLGRFPRAYTSVNGRLFGVDPAYETSYDPSSKFLSGGSGLLSTPGDYLRFAQMLLNGGQLDGARVLSRESVAAMMRNQLPGDFPFLSRGNVEQGGYKFGLAGAVSVDSAAAGVPGNAGIYRWWGYAGTFFWVDPKANLIGMVWTQVIPGRAFSMEPTFQRAVYEALVAGGGK